MLPVFLTAVVCYLIYHSYCLISNIRVARSIGLPYLVVPFNVYSIFWILAGARIYALLEKLPSFVLPRLRRWVRPDWFWYRKYDMYREVQSDIFFLVSASGLLLMVCDADVTHDILSRKDDFPKPPVVHPALDIFGKNVVTTNGMAWKKHRRVITPHFSENYNRLAWAKTLEKAYLLVKGWRPQMSDVSRGPSIKNNAEDFMRMTLHITFFNMFGRQLQWPGRMLDGLPIAPEIPAGHTMSFQSCFFNFLEYSNVLLVSPRWYLKYTPLKAHREAGEAYRELTLYLEQMLAEKRKEIESGAAEGNDLISALLRAKGIGEKSSRGVDSGLTEQEVLGNLFMLVFTGVVTSTNALHYTIMLLALYPEYQIKLQNDLDRILGDRDPIYEQDFQALAEGWAGAIYFEVLRLYPAVPNLPKWTPSPQFITFKGAKYLIPNNIPIHLNTSNIHRHPKYWVPPHQMEQEAAPNEFRPQRWLIDSKDHFQDPASSTNGEEHPARQSFFKPYPGSFFPWSDGQRVCLGKKYSIVEMMAAYLVIFRKWSVELDVREGETPQEARRRAKKYVEDIEIVLAMKPKGEEPAIRYVRRGGERYFPKRE